MRFLSKLSMRGRLAAIALLSLLSVLFLGGLFIAQSLKDVDFAKEEITGGKILLPLALNLASVALGDSTFPTADVEAALASYGTQVGIAGAAKQAPADADPKSIRATIAKLIAEVGDSSNLILDPDLDSFYVMDALITKLPEVMERSASADELYRAAVKEGTGGNTSRVELVATIGNFSNALAELEASVQAARRANPDGTVAGLDASLANLMTAGNGFAFIAREYVMLLGRDGGATDMTQLVQSQQSLVAATRAFAQAGTAELLTLLQARVERLITKLQSTLALAGALVGFAFLVTWFFARGMIGNVHRLETDIRDLADQKDGAVIRALDGNDELAAIARAVEYLQERTVERLRAADAAQLQERERATEAERAAARDREATHEATARDGKMQEALVNALSNALTSLSEGKLDCRIDADFPGRFATVKEAFNATIVQLTQVIGSIKEASGSMRSATAEILAGADDLSTRTTKQAATIQDTRSEIVDLSKAVAENADRAKRGNVLASEVTETVSNGKVVMTKAIDAMAGIKESSAKIANIVGLIDDVAFQTNLLALNASVEAARAGESGKGFAVVAVEVRRLAQSTAEASSNIKQLIEQSSKQVVSGVDLVSLANESLGKVYIIADATKAIMSEISTESQLQAATVRKVQSAISEMDEMTQHNAALVEQTNAAIEQTEGEAARLDVAVDAFKLERADSARSTRMKLAAGAGR